ncbi:MAG: alpha/beta hydrolase [SAR324 cluster bacterium]|nr:alpha/beta hydrolase [SAR324 cluster bacterium]
MDFFVAIAVIVGLPACLLGALHFYTRSLVRRAERAFPPLGQFVEVEGIRLHYLVKGQGPPLVLLHGAFGALQDFAGPLLDGAARHFRVYAFDRPGHGYSGRDFSEVGTPAVQARLIHGALRKLGVERPLLAGFSLGGSVVLAHALHYADDTAGVVMLNGTAFPGASKTEKEYYIPLIPLLGPLLVHTVMMPLGLLLAPALIAKVFSPLPVPDSFARSPVPLTLRPFSFKANAEDMRIIRSELRKQGRHYGGIRAPVVMLAGEADVVVGPQVHVWPLRKLLARCEVRMLPGVGHQILYTHHKEILAALRRGWELAAQTESAHGDRG